MKKPKLYRQGDVLLKLVSKLPETAKQEKIEGPIILAYGEVTGHHHAIRTGNATAYQTDTTRYIEVKGPVKPNVEIPDAGALLEKMRSTKRGGSMALLTHEEHDPIRLPEGIYKIVHQREYHPQEMRRVVD